MKKTLSLSLLLVMLQSFFCGGLFPATVRAQTAEPTPTPVSTPPAPKPNGSLVFGLADGTPVRLKLSRTLSSADAKTGETVDFEVIEDVKIGETIIIPRGGTALATVTDAKPKGRMGKAGKLNINIDSVRTVAGDKLSLRAVKEGKGSSHTGAMTGAIVATSIVFFPAAPLFLFMKGKDISIPKGTEVTAYIDGDSPLDAEKFASTKGAAPLGLSDLASVLVKSTPEGAEIEIDGKFAGSTPSTLQMKIGDHKIVVKKPGFLAWERVITLEPGSNITLDAALEKTP